MSFSLIVRFFVIGMLGVAVIGFFFTALWFIAFFIAFYVLSLHLFNEDGGLAYSLEDHYLNPGKNFGLVVAALVPTGLIWFINDEWLGFFPF